MGSGLISNTEKINTILEKVHAESDIIVSMKMRLGMTLPKALMFSSGARKTHKDTDNFLSR
jgi:tRNA-dihydrouridine synthase